MSSRITFLSISPLAVVYCWAKYGAQAFCSLAYFVLGTLQSPDCSKKPSKNTPSPPNLHHRSYYFFKNTQRNNLCARCTFAPLRETIPCSRRTALCAHCSFQPWCAIIPRRRRSHPHHLCFSFAQQRIALCSQLSIIPACSQAKIPLQSPIHSLHRVMRR